MDPDVIRYIGAALALPLVVACAAAAVCARGAQRWRFLALLGYGAVTVSGQLAALGTPASWRLPALVVITVVAVVTTTLYLLDVRRSAR